ncbi:hypothetical protein, partial [Cohnella sp. REN36]|uniref:hypothetical protein n=1 Tax=Cohnella sp. REN36 TaxID=2887347 RepID=UPI001D159C73
MNLIARFSNKIKDQISLFYTMFCSFIAIILLLVSFNYLSYTFFRNNIKSELIENNSLNLNTTVTNYEKHIKLIKNFLLGFLSSNDTQLLKSGSTSTMHYEIVTKVQKDLQHTLGNSLLYLDNVLYYFEDRGIVIEKDGTRDAATMFSRFYRQPDYSIDFWNREMESADSFKIYPAAAFRIDTAFAQKPIGSLMPVMVKNSYDHHFAFIAMLESSKMFESFHQPIANGQFLIFGPNGRPVFSSTGGIDLPPLPANSAKGYFKIKETYFFYQKGAATGLTYVEIVPNRRLTEQIKKLNIVMLILLLLSLFISLVVSFVIAKRFHNPLASIIRSIQPFNANIHPSVKSSWIKEFNLISSKLHDLSQSNQDIHKDLNAKNSLLQQFAYFSRLKMIQGNAGLVQTSIDNNKPYRLVLFHIDLKERFKTEVDSDPYRFFNYCKEFINAHFTELTEDSLTFQVEKDQILSILFTENDAGDAHLQSLNHLVSILELDVSFCNFTIAVSPIRKQSADFAETYRHVLDLVKQRKLGEDIQVFTEPIPQAEFIIPSPTEESELMANLQSGNDTVTIPLLDKLLDNLSKSGALAYQFQDFSKEIVNKTIKILYLQNISINQFHNGSSPRIVSFESSFAPVSSPRG